MSLAKSTSAGTIAGIALAFGIAVGLAAQAAHAQQAGGAQKSRLNKILETGVLRVGTTGDFRPMSFREPGSSELTGHDVEAAREFAKDMGVKVEFVPTDWKTLITGIVADKYDIAMSGISMNLSRAKVAGFTEPYMEFGTVPITLKKNEKRFNSWADIDKQGVTVSTTLGTVFDAQAKAYFKVATLKPVEAPATGYQEVLSGRADVNITSNVEAATLVKTHPSLMIVPVDRARSRRPASFLVAQDDIVWLNFVNHWISIKKAEGYFDALGKKWLQE
jgi:cyclohexadienyl dehydratase